MSDFDKRFPEGWKVWTNDTNPSTTPHSASNSRQNRELDRLTGVLPPRTRSVPLKVLVPLLMDAQASDSTWLQDFAQDNVVIDADLHDVLMAFQRIRGESNNRDAA